MRTQYFLRKYLPYILLVAWIIGYVLVVIYAGHLMWPMIFLFIFGLFVSTTISPKKNEWCSCGTKWIAKYVFDETCYSEGEKKKDGSYKISYIHYFKAQCTCPHCGKKVEYILTANGGYEEIDSNGKRHAKRIKPQVYLQNKEQMFFSKKLNKGR